MVYIRNASRFPLKLAWEKKNTKKSYPSLPSCITEEYKILIIIVGSVCLPITYVIENMEMTALRKYLPLRFKAFTRK